MKVNPGRELDRRIAMLAIPALGSIAAEPLYNLADTAIVGQLGRVPLDSLAIATSALAVVAWVSIFLSTATTSTVARLAAAPGTTGAAARAVGAAYVIAAGWGIVVAALLALVAPWVTQALGAHGPVQAGATSYLRISAIGLPFLYLSYAGNGHLTGLANTRTPLRIAVSANILNVAAEVTLVFGLHTGLRGSAWGTVAAQVAAAAWYARASWRQATRPRRPGRPELASLLRDGHQLSVRTIALGVVPLAATAIVARLGPVQLGGYQVAYRLWYMLALCLDALAVPGQVYVSASLATGDPHGARRTGRRVLVLGLAAGTALGVITAALALAAPQVFTSDPAIRHAAVIGLLASAVTQPLAALAYVLDGLILGIGDYPAMRQAMIVSIIGFAPLAALTARYHWLGQSGVWAALGLWLASRSVLLGRRWARTFHPERIRILLRQPCERAYGAPGAQVSARGNRRRPGSRRVRRRGQGHRRALTPSARPWPSQSGRKNPVSRAGWAASAACCRDPGYATSRRRSARPGAPGGRSRGSSGS
ncbi:MAG TPA: MATE family efflux transporter [Trebonia sp.]|nr:MATE family efflux transporter [Trebonia sp.]